MPDRVGKILVVDDEPTIRRLVRVVLEGEGHSVDEAENGLEALLKTERSRPDLLVLDVMMPEMDGYTTLKELRKRGLKKNLKVLLLTAKSSEADFIVGWRLGVSEYMTKPFDPDHLARVVRSVLTLTEDQIAEKRRFELDKADLLSRIESAFGEGALD